jgi:7-carboxy-7-deazaguanine synthase
VKNLALHSIYTAIEGEGVHLGSAQVFIRFQGCNIGCLNCDSKETWNFVDNNYSYDQVIAQVQASKLKRVSITGGDPLHPKHVPGLLALIQKLKKLNFFVNLEASGARVIPEVFDAVDFISFDFKTPSTGVKTSISNIEKLIEQFSGKIQIKSVVADQADFLSAYEALSLIGEKLAINPWVLTPCLNTGDKFNPELSEKIYSWNLENGGPFRIINQQHKLIYGTESLYV